MIAGYERYIIIADNMRDRKLSSSDRIWSQRRGRVASPKFPRHSDQFFKLAKIDKSSNKFRSPRNTSFLQGYKTPCNWTQEVGKTRIRSKGVFDPYCCAIFLFMEVFLLELLVHNKKLIAPIESAWNNFKDRIIQQKRLKHS